MGLGPNVALALLDVSEHGACLRLKAPCTVGREVQVTLDTVGRRRPLELPGVVVWAVEAAAGGWCVGVRFEKRLRHYELQDLARG
jgi:hypothetical protein